MRAQPHILVPYSHQLSSNSSTSELIYCSYSFKYGATPIRREIDLDITLYASFSLPMYRKDEDCWIKVFGYGRGRNLCVEGSLKCYGPPCSDELFIKYATGLWIDVEKNLEDLGGEARQVAEDVLEKFYCLSISASPWDKLEVLAAAFLSRNTDYHVNTVRWTRTLLHEISSLNSRNANSVRKAVLLTYGKYRSYQILQLSEVIGEVLSALQADSAKDVENTRKLLIKIKYLGPKVVDSFILHSGLDSARAPIDVHYMRFLKKYGLLKYEAAYPQKSYCARYYCTTCPRAQRCIYAYAARTFKGLNGLIQTASYVSDKLKVESCRDLDKFGIKLLLKKITAGFRI
ncbi:MAG: hypothetical protein NZ925_01500 [Sulfolobales archaeon]|nr:hypothetical protein [Sulfolobales archaeon]